jgi:hypothetical protein
MIDALIILLLVLWLLGLVTDLIGDFNYFLLIAALIIFVIRILTVRKTI